MRTFILVLSCLLFMGLQSCNKKATDTQKEQSNQVATEKKANAPVKNTSNTAANKTNQKQVNSVNEQKIESLKKSYKEYQSMINDPNTPPKMKEKAQQKLKYVEEEINKLKKP